MKGAILVFVAIHCVEFAKNALGIVAHERSQRTESTAVPFAVCAAACYTHPTANEFKTKYLNLKINRSSITNIHWNAKTRTFWCSRSSPRGLLPPRHKMLMQPCFFTARHRNVANTATNTSEMREILCLEPTPKPLRAHPQKERRKRSVQQSVGVLRSSMRRIKSTSRTWNQVDPLVHTIVNLFADHIVVTIYLFIIGFIDAIIHSTTQHT